MFGLFKKLFGKAAPPAPSLASVAAPGPVSVPKPTAKDAAFPSAQPAGGDGKHVAASVAPAIRDANGPRRGEVRISVSAILPALPEGVRSRLALQQNESVVIPLERLVPQLATGDLSLPFDELRRLAPELFRDICNHDTVAVRLPLADVLKQLTPTDYPRRPGQRKIEVPDEVTGLFGEKGQRITVAETVFKQEPRPRPTMPTPSFAPARLAPLSTVPLPSTAPVRAPALPPPASPAPALTAPAAPSVKPAPAISVLAPATASAPTGEVLRMPLAQISGAWPDEVRRDLANLDLATAVIAIPMSTAEQALKSGLVAFPWKQLRQWIDSPVPLAPSPAIAEMIVELPLPIIAPLFMARYRPAAAQTRATVSDSIPDLFGKDAKQVWHPPVPMPSSAPPQAMPVPVRPPVPAAVPAPPQPLPRPLPPAPAPVPAASAPAEPKISLDALMGPVGHRSSAREIVQNISKLPGVIGAMLVMSDGLLVASAMPSSIKGELVAAFLPQICGRMGQYTRDLNMGSLRCLTFTVECGTWQVIRQGEIILAVLCKPDKVLPQNHLASIASELNTQQN